MRRSEPISSADDTPFRRALAAQRQALVPYFTRSQARLSSLQLSEKKRHAENLLVDGGEFANASSNLPPLAMMAWRDSL